MSRMTGQYSDSIALINEFIRRWEAFEREYPSGDNRVDEIVAHLSQQALQTAENLRRVEEIEQSANLDHMSEIQAHHRRLDLEAEVATTQR